MKDVVHSSFPATEPQADGKKQQELTTTGLGGTMRASLFQAAHMARPSKKRRFRPITVDGVRYLWRCDDNRTADLEVHLHQESSARGRLCVNWQCEIPLPITGRIVSSIIREAIASGWTPTKVGSDFWLDLIEIDTDSSTVRVTKRCTV